MEFLDDNRKIINLPSVTIQKIKFNNGEEITLNSDDIVLFVGANNVGKSRALKDIKDDLINQNNHKTIISDIEYKSTNFNKSSVTAFFEENFKKEENGNYSICIEDSHSHYYDKNNIENSENSPEMFYKLFFTFLSTESRLNITKPIKLNYVNDNYSLNILNKLEENEVFINVLNNILLDGFNQAIEIDEEFYNGHYSKKYKVGRQEEISKIIAFNKRKALRTLKSLNDLHNQGDGIRSAVAILASLIVNNHSLYLIDEPETFLHPPQARLLGRNIVDLSVNKQCFISTHNIDLIRGILEKNSARVKIIKIDRIDNNNEFHILNNESIKKIANDKNLKYSNILNGLFYNTVVLCENESDCKFYSAILECVDSNIYQNTLFCAVGGKDQFKIIIPLLKKLKINYLIIGDLDLINDRDRLKDLLNSLEDRKYDNIKIIHDEFLNLFEAGTDNLIKKQSVARQEILQLFTEDQYMPPDVANKIKDVLKHISKLKLLKMGGKGSLPAGDCVNKYNAIIGFLNENNIYVVEEGEIERFITEIDGHGDAWVEKVFNKYPTLEEPAYNKVKDFIRNIFKIN